MDESKAALIQDIENLLNSYEGLSTTINPKLLEFMSDDDLKSIIDSLLTQKEQTLESNKEWLEQFKKY